MTAYPPAAIDPQIGAMVGLGASPAAGQRLSERPLTGGRDLPADKHVPPEAATAGVSGEVKGLTNMVNSIYNGSRFEDLWLAR